MSRGTSDRVPFTQGGPQVFVAVDDDSYDILAGPLLGLLTDLGEPYVIVRASELGDPATQSDFWFGHYEPSAPDRQLLFVTESLERYEQDGAGLVYMDGQLAWPAPPVAFGNPRTCTVGELSLFHEAAIFFSGPEDARGLRQIRIRTIGRLMQLVRPPRVVPGWIDPDWLQTARKAMEPFGPDLATR